MFFSDFQIRFYHMHLCIYLIRISASHTVIDDVAIYVAHISGKTYNMLVLILHSNSTQKSRLIDDFNKI